MTKFAIILELNLAALPQEVPMSIYLAANFAVSGGIWILFRRLSTESKFRPTINHTGLLLLTWYTFTIFAGLFFSFAELETGEHVSLASGFLYGFRIAMMWAPLGAIAFSAPVIWFLRSRLLVR